MEGYESPGTNPMVSKIDSKERKQLFQGTHAGWRSQKMKTRNNICANQRTYMCRKQELWRTGQKVLESDRQEEELTPN